MNTLDYIESKAARHDLKLLMRDRINKGQMKCFEDAYFPPFLYKYTNISKYDLNNLRGNSLTATIPTKFNDLFDSTMHFDTYSKNSKEIFELNQLGRKIGLENVVDEKTAEVLLKNSDTTDRFKSTYLTQGFRIASLSLIPEDIKMWSHYANSNRGICIKYSFNKDIHRISRFIYPVLYIDKPIDVTYLCDCENKINLAVLSSILSKYKEWEHEKEWRIILYVGYQNKERIHLTGIPKPDCIYLGNKFVDNYHKCRREDNEEFRNISGFLSYIKENDISLKIVKPQVRRYVLEFEDVDIEDILVER